MRGVDAHYDYDHRDRMVVKVEKKRGKLNLDEIIEAVQSKGLFGHYVILLNCMEGTGFSGWLDEVEPVGDSATLLPVEEADDCPVCGHLTPLLQYCPSCGERLPSPDDQKGGA